MRRRCALRLPGRPLVWLALVLCALCCAYSLFRLETLPTQERMGELRGVVATVDANQETLLVREAVFCGREGEEALAGNVLLELESAYAHPLEVGSRLCAEVVLLPLEAPDNPGGWDERTRLFTDGAIYRAEGEVREHEDPAHPDWPSRARAAFAEHIAALLPESEEAQVLSALLFGADDALSDETAEAFRRSGTAHLLAVSGLHVGFVLGLAALCFRWMRKNAWPQILLTMLVVVLYAGVAESAFSVWRAAIMLALGLLARRFGRRPDGLSSLAAAVILTLLVRPMEVMRVGFQMSAGAVLGVLLLGPRVDALLQRVCKPAFLRRSVGVTVCAQLGVLPAEVFAFHTLPTLSILTNLAAVPLSAAITVLGLPTVLLHMLHPALAAAPAFVLRLLLQALLLLCREVAALPFAVLSLPAPPILPLVCFLGLLGLCSPCMAELSRRGRRWIAGIVLAATAASLAMWVPAALRPRDPEIAFLSVGTADCALLRSAGGSALVDTGWSGSQAVRALQQEGGGLDAVIVTHADADHAGGLQTVLENVKVGAVYLPLGMSRESVADALAVAEARGIPVRTLSRGDELTVGAFTLTVLWPERVRPGEENADSLVLRAEANGCSALFLADISSETEARLGLPESDVLKVPHHGSANGTTARMLRLVQPEVAVLSVGTPNRYGFPDDGVCRRLEAAGAQIYRTDEQGAVTVVLSEEGVSAAGFSPPSLREVWTGLPEERR